MIIHEPILLNPFGFLANVFDQFRASCFLLWSKSVQGLKSTFTGLPRSGSINKSKVYRVLFKCLQIWSKLFLSYKLAVRSHFWNQFHQLCAPSNNELIMSWSKWHSEKTTIQQFNVELQPKIMHHFVPNLYSIRHAVCTKKCFSLKMLRTYLCWPNFTDQGSILSTCLCAAFTCADSKSAEIQSSHQ